MISSFTEVRIKFKLMKTLKHFLSLFALMVAILSCNQSSPQEGVITVQDYPPILWEPEIDLESHKTGDVEIYRVKIMEEGYFIIYYHDYSGKILNYHFSFSDSTNYDQGFYNWKNDTTVKVKLFNSGNKNERSVELGLRGGVSYMTLLD